jgi:hypothetical protein
MTVTTTSHRSREWLFPWAHMELCNGHETKPINVKLTSETRSVNLHLHCLDEMRRIYFHTRLLSLY